MSLVATPCPHCDSAHIGAGHVWLVTKGRMTQTQLDAIVKTHHRSRCGSFNGRRGVGAGPLTASDRIGHEATIASVFDALESNGFDVVPKGEQ